MKNNRLAELIRNTPLPILESRLLIMHVRSLSRAQLITHDHEVLTSAQRAIFDDLVRRRLMAEPIAYLVGVREFYGLRLTVSSDVLIPRSETELLVDLVLTQISQRRSRQSPSSQISVLDLGTGSGAIAIAMAVTCPNVHVVAVDSSALALKIAQFNADRYAEKYVLMGSTITFLQSDWYAHPALCERSFDWILANPPYIAANDPHLFHGGLSFEPLGALTDHADGLSALRFIVEGAMSHLNTGGVILLEHGYDQAYAVQALLDRHHLQSIQTWRDLAGIQRVTGAVKY